MFRGILIFVVALAGLDRVSAQDWVIGGVDPNEVAIVSSDLFIDGDITILNNGRLEVTGARLTVDGEIGVGNAASFSVTNGTLHLLQTYGYQYTLLLADSATVQFVDATVETGGEVYAYNVAMIGSSTAHFERVTVVGGGITWSFWDEASLTMIDCTNASEFVPVGTGNLTISGTDQFIFWLTLPDGSVVDTTLPAAGSVASWSVGPDSTWATGIPYRVSITDCTNVVWGVMAQSGCDGTFRDSELRAVGAFFSRSNMVTVTGIANNVSLIDTSYAWGDVALRFVNSSVHSWNFYPWGSTNLTLESCLFGELLAADTGQAWVQSSFCDGAGGYISAHDDSTIVFAFSTNLSQTTVSDNAVIIAYGSALLNPAIDADGNAILELLNTVYVGEPAAHDNAMIFDLAVDPIEGVVDGMVSLRGTARMVTTPTSPCTFQDYTLEYGAGDEPTEWFPIGGSFSEEVRDATLATWDTSGLAAGVYSVRVNLANTCPDPVTVISPATLNDGGGTPVPTTSEWGLILMTLLFLTAGTVVTAQRCRACQ